MFAADNIIAKAAQQTGLTALGDSFFREGLEVFLAALDDAAIRPDRTDHLEQWLVRIVANRQRFVDDVARHPDILEQEVGAPIVISTLPRTGSTKLHRMLAASGDFQTLSFWQVHMPSRLPGLPDAGRDERRRITQEFEDWMYRVSPEILSGHPQFTDEAEEDQWLLQCTFRHPNFAGVFDVPAYLSWLMQVDPGPTFRSLRQQLQYSQWQTGQAGKPWLIKSPTHFGAEALLEQAFGGIKVIVSHRDPAKCIPSIAATSNGYRRLFSDASQPANLGAMLAGMFSQAADSHLAWRSGTSMPVLDLPFAQITHDGPAAARSVYDFLGMPLSEAAAARMLAWEAANGREKHGSARYSAEMFGTSDEALRAIFASYADRFGEYIGV
ncbi:sulfotransferase [Novosphingobium sp. 9U]|uniref:sulfotransferase n=1 Tax=Novosphingobium sp. 9U TaxID=2653158 RepID=UPI0012F272FA|nr:sulfotransferase [Novosphingobium sp. 9U]VWX50153.1 conserved hypothetical protein [Novosphingobium sp. 9U]